MIGWKAFFCVISLQLFVLHSQGSSEWDQLRVTFMKFTSYPLTSQQAVQAGWRQDAKCSGKAKFFYGNRYSQKDDDATRLIFDCDGSLAGMQATIYQTNEYPNPHDRYPWISLDDGRVAVTVYFRDPDEICVCKGKCNKGANNKPPIGDRVWIQMADFRLKKDVMVVPLDANQISGTPWVEGTCIPGMGVHYHYNISVDLDCYKSLPVFLLFSQKTKSLIGFGWGGPVDVTSDAWEKPDPSLFARSMKPETTPACLKDLQMVSVQHVYFVDPLKIACV
ncbi:hypothetical protein pdam_00012024 [Pocillopora damicornis]|uniref:Uncharacterized protein n=1 Tax=Pocillopora damicornis TaxID=46731 RepID=A0A3M6THV6_POCDA|nr:uncharacterized protein LOC113677490 [Pocillopora damicornis]RMX40889.1 hypothetical protein pdam_00012024 [Pocillopora damicornis]